METISSLKAWTQKSQNILLVKGITREAQIQREEVYRQSLTDNRSTYDFLTL